LKIQKDESEESDELKIQKDESEESDLKGQEIKELYPANDSNAEVLSLIITCYGPFDYDSYDQLFLKHKQEVPDGIVTVYRCTPYYLQILHKRLEFNEKSTNEIDIIEKIVKEIKELDPENVLINLECCDYFEDGISQELFNFFKFSLDRGYMLMFSDFSMIGLINSWKSDLLGPCPFVQLSTCNGSLNLNLRTTSA